MFYKLFLITLAFGCSAIYLRGYPKSQDLMDFNTEQGSMILSASEQEIVDQYNAVEDYTSRDE